MIPTIYIGWDPAEAEAARVLRFSLFRRTSLPLDVKALRADRLPPTIYDRPVEWRGQQRWCPISDAPMATAFSNARFAIPWICQNEVALFMDCDMLCRDDIQRLFRQFDPTFAVQVVKHHHEPAETEKMGGLAQVPYPRKNWSSVVLWNLAHPAHERFTLDDLNKRPGRDLHAFFWLHDHEIGDLTPEWNRLVGVWGQEITQKAGLWHFTLGGPWFPWWIVATEMDRQWCAERDIMLSQEGGIEEWVMATI